MNTRLSEEVTGLDLQANNTYNEMIIQKRNRWVPGLSQILKPEIESLKASQVKPRPHPPLSLPRLDFRYSLSPAQRV